MLTLTNDRTDEVLFECESGVAMTDRLADLCEEGYADFDYLSISSGVSCIEVQDWLNM